MTRRERLLLVTLPRVARAAALGGSASLLPLVAWWLAVVCPTPPAWVVALMLLAGSAGASIVAVGGEE